MPEQDTGSTDENLDPLTGSGAPPEVEPEDDAVDEVEDEPAEQPEPVVHGGVIQDNVTEEGVQRTIQPDGAESVHTVDDVEQGPAEEVLEESDDDEVDADQE